MGILLKRAFDEAAKLSEKEQNAFAAWLLEELACERRWNQTFEASPDILEHLAEEALTEHIAGKTRNLDPETL